MGLGFRYPFAYRARCTNDPKRFNSDDPQENKSELSLVWMLTTGLHEISGSQRSQLKKKIKELSRAKRASGVPWVRKWSNLPIRENLVITWPYTARPRDRPSAPQAYQCKISQSTGMATQMQLEVILAGNRIATRVCKAEATKESIKTKPKSGNCFCIRVF